ncbi:hypothetical protein E0H88_13340 [Acinetobacter sp. ANC 4216]|uniref:hypothetical protein n=1 Tax=Acinetobacter sp. ANC 4216 TaxID=2529840 RepID=UPI00103D9ED4|nr:hypothetical protein [Acinetobacter sp. ANC 4216]TCB66779.1 hypothetical protein E0H88_13340 [Acinetobacter sp. ANC 4216]
MYCSYQIKEYLDKILASFYVPEIELDFGNFNNSKSLKNEILSLNHTIEFPNDSLTFNIFVDENSFKNIIQTEINSEFHRISEQIKNIDFLIKSKAQAAWILVTVYYACFFMANLINRLLGRASINFSTTQLKSIFLNDTSPPLTKKLQENLRNLNEGSNHNYTCIIERSQQHNFLKIRLIPGGDKPHQAVWSNLFCNLNILDKKIENTEIKILKNIVNISEQKFPLPSKLRNDWNYSDQKYFSRLGTETAKDFLHLIQNPNALNSWILKESNSRNLTLKSTQEENRICSLAYVYCVLKEVFEKIVTRPSLPKNHRHLPNRLKNKKKKKRGY